MKVVMNDLRKAVLAALAASNKALTLAEISEAVGQKVSSGSTNPMVAAGYIAAEDIEIEYNKVRVDNGAVIGKGHVTVKAYTLGEVQPE